MTRILNSRTHTWLRTSNERASFEDGPPGEEGVPAGFLEAIAHQPVSRPTKSLSIGRKYEPAPYTLEKK